MTKPIHHNSPAVPLHNREPGDGNRRDIEQHVHGYGCEDLRHTDIDRKGPQMHIDDVYGGSWLKAEHLGGIGGKQPVVTIESWSLEEFEDSKTCKMKKQIALKFVGKDRRLGLNQTNANNMMGIVGSGDPADWPGSKIQLFCEHTNLGPGIRVRNAPAVASAPPPQPQHVAPPAPLGGHAQLNESDIPFDHGMRGPVF